MIYPSAVFSFITGPVRTEEKDGRIILTHLQKFSPFGFLVTWPFCFHFWVFWKLQEMTDEGAHHAEKWKPGTEKGIYGRTPGYRWDQDLGLKWTWGYLGGHWD